MTEKNQKPAIYLGQKIAPNMEAYLDSLQAFESVGCAELLVTEECDVPSWIEDSFTIRPYDVAGGSGFGRIKTVREVVDQYLTDHNADEIRQVTQPRWHAPGVLLGSKGRDVRTICRVPSSMFGEWREANATGRAFAANNIIGRLAFFADEVRTPSHDEVSDRIWRPATVETETVAVNGERFEASSTKPLEGVFQQANRKCLTVGRISERKGVDLVVHVAEKLPDWEFVIAGSVADESLAEEASGNPNISMIGNIPYKDMPRLYAATDVVASLSRHEWGGVSRAMLEAKAMNRRLIALDRGRAERVADATVPPDAEKVATAICDMDE